MGKYVIAIDLGGTQVKLGIFDETKEPIEKWAIDTDISNKGANVLSDISNSVRKKINSLNISVDDVMAAGMGVPGPVEGKSLVKGCVSIGWDDLDVGRILGEMLGGIPVVVENDANTATLGEMWKGGGKGHKSLVMLTLGTDIGGGIIVNGNVVSGAFGGGGEVGHMVINPNETEPHACGKCGCFGYYGSGTGLARIARRKLSSSEKDSVLRRIDTDKVTAKDELDAARAGDELALEIFEEYCDYLGRGLAIISNVVEPEVFVLGGGVSKAGDFLTEGVKKYYRNYCFHTAVNTQIVTAKLTNDAGIYGAAYMAFDLVKL